MKTDERESVQEFESSTLGQNKQKGKSMITLQVKCGVCDRTTNIKQTYKPQDDGYKYCSNRECNVTILKIDGKFVTTQNSSRVERLITKND